MEEITAVIINYNGGSLVLDSIESILNQQGVHVHVIVMDDGSTDGSPEVIKERFPDVEVYREERNTKRLNQLRNKGLCIADTRKVFLTDNDVIFDDKCIHNMVHFMKDHKDVCICIPRLMYIDEKSKIYSEGGKIHYVGATVSLSRDGKMHDRKENPGISVGGGIALFDTERISDIGFFDEEYKFGWGCDGELHQRVLLAGKECVCVPSAVGFHEYKELDESRYYRVIGQVYNRWRYILTHYSGVTLFLASPALCLYELAQATFCFLKGVPHLYIKGIFDTVQHLPETLRKRREIQSLRVVPDRDLLVTGRLYVRPSEGIRGKMISAVVTMLSLLFTGYWFLVRPLLPRGVSSRHVTEDTSGESEGGGASEVGRMGGN
jgi:GT2 family glycosyltransferase